MSPAGKVKNKKKYRTKNEVKEGNSGRDEAEDCLKGVGKGIDGGYS